METGSTIAISEVKQELRLREWSEQIERQAEQRNEHYASERRCARSPDSVGAGIMLNDLTTGIQMYIVIGYSDLRKGSAISLYPGFSKT